jgi:HNH endonuclease
VECSVPGCGRPEKTPGLCQAHLRRFETHSDVLADVPVQVYTRGRKGAPCSINGCEEPIRAREWCSAHYQRWRSYGDPLAGDSPVLVTRRKPKPCSIEGCSRPLGSRGWCNAHYARWKTYGDPLAGGPSRAIRGTGPTRWEKDEIRRAAKAKLSQVTGETAEYVSIIRRDPCAYCGAPMKHVDHVVPFADGGPTDWTNLAPACARCNRRKNWKSVLFFMLSEMGGDTGVGRASNQAA